MRRRAGAALAQSAPSALMQQPRGNRQARQDGFEASWPPSSSRLRSTLLAGAGVLLASFYRLMRVGLGFRADAF